MEGISSASPVQMSKPGVYQLATAAVREMLFLTRKRRKKVEKDSFSHNQCYGRRKREQLYHLSAFLISPLRTSEKMIS